MPDCSALAAKAVAARNKRKSLDSQTQAAAYKAALAAEQAAQAAFNACRRSNQSTDEAN
jgi:hypothetical protein